MPTILMRLEGPMQAWAGSSLPRLRPTGREPTKSAVIGIMGAALGLGRGDPRLSSYGHALIMAVRVDLPGTILVDFHTVGGGGEGTPTARRRRDSRVDIKRTASTGQPETDVSERGYLADASFLVALTGAASLVAEIDAALRQPHWKLFLGRSSCPPAVPIAAGIVAHDSPTAALHAAALHPRTPTGTTVRIVRDCAAGEGFRRMDAPRTTRFGSFGPRWVCEELWLPSAQTRPGIDTMDG